VGETSAAIDAYKRQREQKGKRDEMRRRDAPQSRRRSRSVGSDMSDEDAEAESDLELDNRRSPSIPKDDPPAELRDIQRARVGRSNFAQVCFYPGFEDAITGCYARVNIGPNADTGMNEYRVCLITGFTTGKPYALEATNGRPFVTDQYAKMAHGKAIREFPFIACSDSAFTEAEYNRYRKTMAVEDGKIATQTKVASKVADINRLINHQFTPAELNEKLRKQGAFDGKRDVLRRVDLERDLKFAKANGDEDEVEKLQKELDKILNPNLSWGTTLIKPAADKTLSEAERVHLINLRNQKLNHENVRRAQIEERKAARKAAAAVARGEASTDPFMRVRTIAKTHHDLSDKPKEEIVPADDMSADTPKEASKASTPSVATPSSLTPKPKSGFMISYRKNDDEAIGDMDLGIDIDI
jgi:RNA polymerase-associated protein RTF1